VLALERFLASLLTLVGAQRKAIGALEQSVAMFQTSRMTGPGAEGMPLGLPDQGGVPANGPDDSFWWSTT
jgi:hypothetical protein